MLQRLGVDPAGVLYSNPVKPPAHIAEAHRAGLWRFSFDSPNELTKIAEHAAGAACTYGSAWTTRTACSRCRASSAPASATRTS